MSGVALVRLFGRLQQPHRAFLSSLGPTQDCIVDFGKERALNKAVRPEKISFKDLVTTWKESGKENRFLVRGVTKGGADPIYFTLEPSFLDRFLRKNKEDKSYSAIERMFVSDDLSDSKAERMSRKEVVIKVKSTEHDQMVGITKARNFLQKGSTLVTLTLKGGSKMSDGDLQSFKAKITEMVLQEHSDDAAQNQSKKIHSECLIVK